MLSISGKKEQHLAMFFCFSIPVLNQRAWFSGKPVPQFKKTQKKNPQKKLLVVSYRKKEKPQLLALILHIALFKNFLCQKKKKEKNKKMLKAGV